MFHHLFIGKLSSGGTFQSGVKTNFSWRNAVYLFLKTHRHDFFFFFLLATDLVSLSLFFLFCCGRKSLNANVQEMGLTEKLLSETV